MTDTFSIIIFYFKYFKLIFNKNMSKPIIPTFHIKSMSNVYSFIYLLNSNI